MNEALLADIRQFLSETGMSEGRFGLKACSNARLVEQLEGRPRRVGDKVITPKRPGRVWPETEMKIRVFMASYRAEAA